MAQNILAQRAIEYARLSGMTIDLERPLGVGPDGQVWKSGKNTAIKALERELGYFNERDSYLRVAEWGLIPKIDKFAVPRMIGCDDRLMVIEMDLMTKPPFIIDFAKVRIDRPPDFSEEQIRETVSSCQELFGHHWPEVRKLLVTLENHGIYYLDPKPWNITFPDLM